MVQNELNKAKLELAQSSKCSESDQKASALASSAKEKIVGHHNKGSKKLMTAFVPFLVARQSAKGLTLAHFASCSSISLDRLGDIITKSSDLE